MVLDKPIKVMLIDDDPGIHESLRDLVEEEGYEFCGALSGKEGLRLLDQERPDLLLLDVMMPGMNGFDVCRQMRDEGRRIPVIFLTAKNDIVDKSTGFKAGADDYVTKPFIADELLLRIDATAMTCSTPWSARPMPPRKPPLSPDLTAWRWVTWKCCSIATRCGCAARRYR